MYIPKYFEQAELSVCHDLIEKYAFGILISHIDGVPYATHLPFLLDRDGGGNGTLLGHMALANPHWRAFGDGAADSLVIFQGPHGYVSPRWYVNGPVVPSWNYVVVHAYGAPKPIEDPDAIEQMLVRLTAREEAGAQQPWCMDSVDEKFLRGMKRGIAAFEIPLARLEGKWKLSQNRAYADREKVIAALRESGAPDSAALADLMAAEAGKNRDR